MTNGGSLAVTTDIGGLSFAFNAGDGDIDLAGMVPELHGLDQIRGARIGDLFQAPERLAGVDRLGVGVSLGELDQVGTDLGNLDLGRLGLGRENPGDLDLGHLGAGTDELGLHPGPDGREPPGKPGLATDPPVFVDPTRRLPFVWRDPIIIDRSLLGEDSPIPWTWVPTPPRNSVHRGDLDVPVAPSASPTDGDLFESPDGGTRYALPRYSLAFETTGDPRVSIVERDGTAILIMAFAETPSPAAAPGVAKLPHLVTVSLKYRVPVITGGTMVLDLPFPSVRIDGTSVVAEMPLTTPGLRQQLLAALSSLEAGVSLVVGRAVTVGVPTGETMEDGLPGYRKERLLLEWTAPPAPLVISEAHRNRLGGVTGGIQPMGCVRIPFDGRSHPYWQDPARPERFYFLPDRFLLARLPGTGRPPALKVRATSAASVNDVRVTLEFYAQPVLVRERLEAARPVLEEETRVRGVVAPVRLEVLPDPQPVLRLALPQGGAPSIGLVERPEADIDLELGVTHAETLALEDFRLVYDALFGASLSLLRGEVRVGAGGASEDVPLELRFDCTAGDVLTLTVTAASAAHIEARLTNGIESRVRPGRPAALAVCADRQIPLSIEGLADDLVLPPGEGLDVRLVPRTPLPETGAQSVVLDQSGVVVDPDREAIWARVFDRTAQPQLVREVSVEAVPALFAGPQGDRVAAFVVTVERGGTVRLTEDAPTGVTSVRVPVQPLLTGAPPPPLRYRTETWWQSGGIGVSDWRETEATILLPVRTAPTPTTPTPSAQGGDER
ncbi:hypothetical protein Misp03_76450 [Microbispora sp. NBRC 16548]|nr:hypothetical protein Misp03_76450 [Microbispora sp. NBRC 16548]